MGTSEASRNGAHPPWSTGRAGASSATDLDVVVLDAAQRQSLVSVRQLGRAGRRVGAVECRSFGPAPAFSSRWCAAHSRVSDRRVDVDAFVDDVLDLLDQRAAKVVLPTHDGTIEAIRERRSDFEQRCAVALAPEPALGSAIDKSKTFDVARRVGITLPRSVTVSTHSEIADALAEIGLPVVVKPARSWVVGPSGASRLTVSGLASRASAYAEIARMLDLGAEVIVQQWLSGTREAISFVHANGNFHGEFAQMAHRTLPALGGCSIMRESVEVPSDLGVQARALVAAMELDGYAEVEFRRDADGRPALMEINPRLSASVEVAVRAGVDFPELVFQWAAGERIHGGQQYRAGVRMRWLDGDLKWLRETWANQGQPDVEARRRALYMFARDSVRPTGYDFLDRSDIRPATHAFGLGAWKMLAGLRDRQRSRTNT